MSYTIAIPAAGPTLASESVVALPHSPYLLLVDPRTGAFEAHENPAASAASHPGVVVAKFLVTHGVEVVLGHYMGPHPAAALAKAGVKVHEGRPGTTASELLELYRAGELSVMGEEEINARHGPHHGHGGGHHHDGGNGRLH